MKEARARIVSTNNLAVSTEGLQCLLSAGRVECVEDPEVSGRDFRVRKET